MLQLARFSQNLRQVFSLWLFGLHCLTCLPKQHLENKYWYRCLRSYSSLCRLLYRIAQLQMWGYWPLPASAVCKAWQSCTWRAWLQVDCQLPCWHAED
jgi:hypothetical protein